MLSSEQITDVLVHAASIEGSGKKSKELADAIRDLVFTFSIVKQSKYKRGDQIFKYKGSYRWFGVVSCVCVTPAGKVRYVVAHEIPKQSIEGTGCLPQVSSGWLLHIYAEKDIEPSPFIAST